MLPKVKIRHDGKDVHMAVSYYRLTVIWRRGEGGTRWERVREILFLSRAKQKAHLNAF